jgi:hypothetical protein
MPRRFVVTLSTLLAFGVLAGPARSQQSPEAEKAEAPTASERPRRGPSATLRVHLVITRFQGEKKVESLPYTLNVTAEGHKARLRMGVETPVPVTQYTTTTSEGSPKPSTSFQYKNVGTNIDCSAREVGEGHYELMLGIENSSVLADRRWPLPDRRRPRSRAFPSSEASPRRFNPCCAMVRARR